MFHILVLFCGRRLRAAQTLSKTTVELFALSIASILLLTTTASGERCRLKAQESGYCHLHDPAKLVRRQTFESKKRNLQEVQQRIEQACQARGWKSHNIHTDLMNWEHASVLIGRDNPWRRELADGIIDIDVMNNNVTLSFTSYMRGPEMPRLARLCGNILAELRKSITWATVEMDSMPSSKEKERQSLDQFEQLLQIIRRFHIVVEQFKQRRSGRENFTVIDEYDVQDLLHALLRIPFDDVRAEEYTPSYAAKASRIDFLLKGQKIAVEAKMTRNNLRDKEIADQLIIDISRYQSHPHCETLVCFIYDPNRHISNPVGLENDLSKKHGDLQVHVLVVPR